MKRFLGRDGTVARLAELLRLTPFDTSSPEGRSKERNRRILLGTITNFLARGVSMLVNLLVVRVVFGRLGRDEYGLWVAITSFVIWTSLFDFGILNGLVNAVAEAYGKEDRNAIVGHVSTAFYFLLAATIVLLVGSFLLAGRIQWSEVFSARGLVDESTMEWSVLAAVVPILAALPLSIVRQVYAGLQKPYLGNVFVVASSLLTLVATWTAVGLGASLPGLVLATGVGAPIAALLNLVYLVNIEMPWITPRLSLVSLEAMRRLLQSSVPLFLFQLGALLVNNTQPLLLAHLTSLSTVGDYSLLLRLSGLLGSITVLATSSFVPAFREAHERGDRDWVRRSFRRMLGLRLAMVLPMGVALVLGGNAILRIWLGQDSIRFTTPIWLTLAAVMAFSAWGTAFSALLTIMDRIWIQVGFVLLNGATTVLLTIWLAPAIGVLGALVALGFTPVAIWSWAGPALSRPTLRLSAGSAPVT